MGDNPKELEDEIEILKNKKPLDLPFSSKGIQTYSSDCRISCNLCIYEATCEDEFNWHMEDAHDENRRIFFEKVVPCDIC